MGKKDTDETGFGEIGQMPDAVKRLSPQQVAALRCLLQGRNITDTARECGMCRNTVSTWVNQNDLFKRAIEACKQLQMHAGPVSEAKAFQEAESTPLLSLLGLRKRMQLLDVLLLRDLQSRQPQRSQLIARLQTMIGQARDYLASLTSDEVAADQVRQQVTEYRDALLQAVARLLSDVPDGDAKLLIFRNKLKSIDEKAGILE